MERYFSYISFDGTDMQADWRRSCTYGRATDAIDAGDTEDVFSV